MKESGVWVTLVDGEVLTIHNTREAAESYAADFGLRVGFKRWGATTTVIRAQNADDQLRA